MRDVQACISICRALLLTQEGHKLEAWERILTVPGLEREDSLHVMRYLYVNIYFTKTCE